MNETIRNTVPDTTCIPLTNPAIVAVIAEGQVIHPMIARLQPLVSAMDGASPDLAVAMWVRFRQVVVEFNKSLIEERRHISNAAQRDRRVIDDAALDADIATLPTHSLLLHHIGRFRAAAFVINAFGTVQILERAPTKVMRKVLEAIQAHSAHLLADLDRMVQMEMEAHVREVGALIRPGEVKVNLSVEPTTASMIVVRH